MGLLDAQLTLTAVGTLQQGQDDPKIKLMYWLGPDCSHIVVHSYMVDACPLLAS